MIMKMIIMINQTLRKLVVLEAQVSGFRVLRFKFLDSSIHLDSLSTIDRAQLAF
jgi:hypothetical protein